jgi:DNA-nicking Smr family endonuclease
MKKRPPPDARRGHLSKEDTELWESTAANLKPLSKAKPRVPAKDAEAAEVRSAPAKPEVDLKAHLKNLDALFSGKGREAEVSSSARVSKAPAPAAFDRKTVRKFKIGKAEIEARIDLHGMRQREAHAALRRFLMSCHAQGRRYVLVITGKGGPSRREADEAFEMGGREERGVIKRNVPAWLAEPELRAIVVSYGAAAIAHGGEGALYVHLRSRERT